MLTWALSQIFNGSYDAGVDVFPRTLNDIYNVTDKLFAIFQNGKRNQDEIFTIAKSFNETNIHVKIIDKYFVYCTTFDDLSGSETAPNLKSCKLTN